MRYIPKQTFLKNKINFQNLVNQTQLNEDL